MGQKRDDPWEHPMSHDATAVARGAQWLRHGDQSPSETKR